MDEILADEKSILQDEGVDCSSSCMRAFVWDFEGSQMEFSSNFGNLQNPTQMLSYNRLKFSLFQIWSSKGAKS